MWVLSRHCLLGKLATISYKTGTQNQKFFNQKTWPMLFFDVSETPKKILPHFSTFWPIFRHLYNLFVALSQKAYCETLPNYQKSMYNSNTDSLGLILDVEFFFSLGHCSGALGLN